jgi:two-component system, sensor histidine kinase YesM
MVAITMAIPNLNNVGLRNKFLLVYILSVFIPILVTNVIYYQMTSQNVIAQKKQDMSLAFEQTANEFRQNVDDAIGISTAFYTDSRLHQFFEQEYESILDYMRAYETVLRNIDQYSPIYSSIQSVTFFTDNPTVVYAGGVNELNESVRKEAWYTQLHAAGNTPVVTRLAAEGFDQTGSFSVFRTLDHFSANTYNKIVRIDLDPRQIDQAFQNVTFQGDVFLLNAEGGIEYTTDPDVSLDRSPVFDFQSLTDNMILFEHQYHSDHLNGWQMVGVASERTIFEDVQQSRTFILYLSVINFVVPSLIIIFITSSLHARLLRILRHMKRVKHQHFDAIPGVEYRDEIGQLTAEFNRMSNRIKQLIQDVYVANLQKKDMALKQKQAQLSALQSQVNPHFLFNALETIRMRSMLKKEHETANIIHNLATNLRHSVTWGKDWVTVEEEINMALRFLDIQQYRFGDRLTYSIDVDKAAKQCVLPNMSLIPFVENASIHGIEKRKGPGHISVRVNVETYGLVCMIHDNGAGMDSKRLAQVVQSLEGTEDMGENVGIKNVYYRLKMLYDHRFRFYMCSAIKEGTTVRIILPAEH